MYALREQELSFLWEANNLCKSLELCFHRTRPEYLLFLLHSLAAVHGVSKNWTRLGNFTFTFHFHALEKEMATHSSVLAWRIPGTAEPGGLLSMGSHRVGHDWATSLSLFTFMHWRRKWQPTPVFLPGESQGQWGLVGCHLWGCTESDTTEVT